MIVLSSNVTTGELIISILNEKQMKLSVQGCIILQLKMLILLYVQDQTQLWTLKEFKCITKMWK